MIRRLRVLAAFFMVPVVFFASPAHAVGPWQTVRIEVPAAPLVGDSAPGTLDTIDCTFSLRQTGGVIDTSTGACYGLPDVTPGWTQPGESGAAYRMRVAGISSTTQAVCGGDRTGTLGQHSANGTLRVAGTIPSGTIYAGDGDCSVTEVCFQTGTQEGCIEFDLPPVEEDPDYPHADSCTRGYPSAKFAVSHTHNDANGNYVWTTRVEFARTGAPFDTTPWKAVLRYENGTTAEFDFTTVKYWDAKTTTRLPNTGPPSNPPIGIELVAIEPGGMNDPWTASRAGVIGQVRPTLETHAYHGWTQPQWCRFYYGQKVVNDAASDEDDPEGDGTGLYVPPPPEPEPVVDPPDEDPDPDVIDFSWLWSILDAIRRAIVAVGSAISGLATAIIDGVKEALKTVFIPEDDYLDAKWSGVEAKFDDTSPGLYLDELQSFQVGGGSGCGGVPLDVTLPGNVDIHQNIGAACSGPMATASSIVRNTLSAVMFVGGAIACVRAVGSGLGWNPGVRGGAA